MRAIKFQGKLWRLLEEGAHTVRGKVIEVVEASSIGLCSGCEKLNNHLYSVHHCNCNLNNEENNEP